MRDLTTTELQAVSGGVMAPRPRDPATFLGVKLSKKDSAILGAIIRLVSRPQKK